MVTLCGHNIIQTVIICIVPLSSTTLSTLISFIVPTQQVFRLLTTTLSQIDDIVPNINLTPQLVNDIVPALKNDIVPTL